MKRKFTLITAALALLTLMWNPIGLWADEASYVFNTDAGIAALGISKPSSGAGTNLSASPYVVGQISMSVTHGGTNTRVWNSSGTLELRIYTNGTLTFAAASGYNITGIVLAGNTVDGFSANVGTISSGSWSNSTTGAASVTLTATGTEKINTITVTYTSTGGGGSTPSITVSKNSITNLNYNVGSGPSTAQSFKVSGSNLGDTDITLEMIDGESSDFEMSLNESSGYNTSLTLTQSSGTVSSTDIYVRLKAGKAVANYEDEINLTSSTASKTVSLAGSVIPASVSWDLTTAQFSSQSIDLVTWTSAYASMTNAKNGSSFNANAYLGGTSTYTNTHFYTNHKLTISPASHYAISKIEITATSSTYANTVYNATWSNATKSVSGSVVTITPSNGDLDVSAVFGGTTYVTGVVVYYVASTAEFYTITVNDMLNGNVVADRNEAVAGRTITLSAYPDAGYYLDESDISGVEVTKVNAATFTFTMPASNVTVSAEFSVYDGTYYTLVNSTEDLIPGRHYIIANSKTNGAAYAMGPQTNSNYRDQVSTIVAGTMIYETSGIAEIVLSGDATNHWTINDGTTPGGYLYAAASNYLKTFASNSYTQAAQWAITITDGEASIVSYISGNNVSNTIRHNSGSTRFSCYTPTNTMAPVYLYMKANETTCKLYSATTIAKEVDCATCDLSHTNASLTIANHGILNCSGAITGATTTNLIIEDGGQLICNNSVQATVKKNINAASSWGGSKASDVDGWYTISPTVASYAKSNLGDTDTYDLYLYNESDHYWWNANGTAHPFSNLAGGRGYLYASENDVTISYAGEMWATNANVITELSYTPAAGDLAGVNLVGNRFTRNLIAGDVKLGNTALTTYYVAEGGDDIEARDLTSNPIKPGQGFIVQVGGSGINIEYNPTSKGETAYKPAFIRIEAGNERFMDRAYVQIGQGNTLRKMTLNNEVSHVYVMDNGKDYAAATIPATIGEMPVNFEVTKNGTYTLTVTTENLVMDYLHLIDNMTGNDIDLLATPTYTFSGKTTDYATRFHLVFSVNDVEENEDVNSANFAYFDGSNWVVSNTGKASLQVVDVTGRLISSEVIEGNASLKVTAAPGLYVMRLVSGNNVRVQKIVVR